VPDPHSGGPAREKAAQGDLIQKNRPLNLHDRQTQPTFQVNSE
jgi:hypothetical protein